MKKIFDFKCSSCLNEFEEYTEYKQFCICSACGGEATKVIKTPTIKLEGITGSFPSAAWAWDKKHTQQLAKEKKQSES
jgi:predicted nucleic acid-binding Zn ribbon protein